MISMTPTAPAASSNYDQIMQRMQVDEKHEQAVNEVMEEIEDQLDSDEDDKGFLITTNASSGGSHPTVGGGGLLDTGN